MFKLSTDGRLNKWKNFRRYIGKLSLQSAMQETVQFWQPCPFSPFYLDQTNPQSWPDPWTLIEENYYCDLAKVLGIVYTLVLSDHRDDIEPEIHIYHNQKTKHHHHIAYFCQGKYVINLIEGEVVNKEHIIQPLALKTRYTASQLYLDQY